MKPAVELFLPFAFFLLPYHSPMAEDFVCAQCDRTEDKCDCERYCILCKGQHDVRLCQDGQYYCLECREACDLAAQA